MCGRYIPNSEDELLEIREILKQIAIRITNVKTTEVYPSSKSPIILKQNNNFFYDELTFGLLKWDNKGRIFNVRSEGNYYQRFIDNKCIIPARCYFEWSNKEKYQFKADSNLYILGVFNEDQFMILTKDSDQNIKTIHDRMPVIIQKEYINDWFNDKINLKNLNGLTQTVTGVKYEV